MYKHILHNFQLLLTACYYSFFRRDKNLWVFGEWFGCRCCDNAMYFANYVCRNHPEITLKWICKPSTDTSGLDAMVERVEMDTRESKWLLKHAGFLFVVQNFGDLTGRKFSYYFTNAKVVNFWHGVPWKRIGGDRYSSKWIMLYRRIWVRKFETQIYLASSDKFADILHRAFNCSYNNIIRAGYPRNSLFFDANEIDKYRRKLLITLKDISFETDSSVKIITYMPTFRDNTSKVFSFESIKQNEELCKILESYNAIIIEKGHHVSTGRLHTLTHKSASRVLHIKDYNTQELLAATDILITDYSSCFFDYLLLNRPIIHYLYDYNYYMNNDRGLYYSKEEVACGDCPSTLNELLLSIQANLVNPMKDESLRMRQKKEFIKNEGANSCEVIFSNIVRLRGFRNE